MQTSLAPFDRGSAGENPYKVQSDLQDTMQDLVGIVRQETEMQEALTRLAALNARAEAAGVDGHREYHTGWHTCLDLRNLLTVSEAITRSAIERKESRGGHFREDYPDKDPAFATFNVAVARDADGAHAGVAHAHPGDAGGAQAGHRGAETMTQATFRIWRGGSDGRGAVRRLHDRSLRGHGRARRRAPRPGRSGAGPGVPLELQGRQVRLVLGGDQRPAEADVHDAAEHARPDRSRSRSSRCGRSRSIKDLVTDVSWNFRVKPGIKKFTPRKPDAADGTWRMAQRDIDRVQEFRKCIECFLCQDVCHVIRDHKKHDEGFIGPRFFVYSAALEMHPLDTADRLADLKDAQRARLLQHHQVLHERLPRAHPHHRQRDHSAQGARGGPVLRSGDAAAADVPVLSA